MTPHTVMTGLLAGGLAIALGLAPRLSNDLAEGLRRFRDTLLFGAPLPRRSHMDGEIAGRPLWLAGLGAVIVVSTLTAYVLS